MTDTYTWTEYDKFSDALNALRGFSYLINTAFDDQPSPRDMDGIVTILGQQIDTLDGVFKALHSERKAQYDAARRRFAAVFSGTAPDAEPKGGNEPETAAEMRARREANIRQIMRDVDYSQVARAHGMDPVKLRAILYELMEAPQKANPGARTMDTMMPAPSGRQATEKAQMTSNEWFSAVEIIATANDASKLATEGELRRLASISEGTRRSEGGDWEYHVSILPTAARDALTNQPHDALAGMHGPIPDHFEREAIAERLTGGSGGLETNVR